MKYFLIFNPTAHQGRSVKSFEKILNLLTTRNVHFDYAVTSKKDEAIELASKATREKYDIVVAVGGDGTISEVRFETAKSQSSQRLICHKDTKALNFTKDFFCVLSCFGDFVAFYLIFSLRSLRFPTGIPSERGLR